MYTSTRAGRVIGNSIRGVATALLLWLAGASAQASPETPATANRSSIEQILAAPDAEVLGERIYMQSLLREIYRDHDYEPLWIGQDSIAPLNNLIRDSSSHGLHPRDYHFQLIEQLEQARHGEANAAELASLDILLTDGLLLYGYHRRYGKVKAQDLDPDINFRREAFSDVAPATAIRQAIDAGQLPEFIEQLAPTADYYDLLRLQLHRYEELADHGGWPEVPDGPSLHPGDRDARMIAVRRRLQIEAGVADSGNPDPEWYDASLEPAVREFQLLHGLDNDGVVGKKTLAAMNIPAETRVDQLRLSLERLRWLTLEAGDVFVAVNIAGFQLSFVRHRKVEWTTRVMVGTAYRKTPLFRADITSVDFNPSWTVPPTILREDILPALKKDPAVLQEKNLNVIDSAGRPVDPSTIDWTRYGKTIPYMLRQYPGPGNALGKVKIVFPNPHFVFMHDTPHQNLFQRPERTFSSGCIRVENALTLAQLLLEETPAFDPANLASILDSGKTQRVKLAKPIPVLILYLTAALDPSGKARFYPDVYRRDAEELRALDGPITVDL